MSFEIDVVLKSCVVLLAAMLTVLALRRASASVRHGLWAAALLASILVPIVPKIFPVIPLPLFPERASLPIAFVASAPEEYRAHGEMAFGFYGDSGSGLCC